MVDDDDSDDGDESVDSNYDDKMTMIIVMMMVKWLHFWSAAWLGWRWRSHSGGVLGGLYKG